MAKVPTTTRLLLLGGIVALLTSVGCREEPAGTVEVPEPGAITGPNTPTPYALDVPDYFPAPILDPENPRIMMQRLRRLFNRARPNEVEMNILRGILTAAQKSGTRK